MEAALGGPEAVPLLLHLDVNKTIIHTDGTQSKDADDGLREGTGDLFWGRTCKQDGQLTWRWTRAPPSCLPSEDDVGAGTDNLTSYAQYVRKRIVDKKALKEALMTFTLAGDDETKQEMEDVLRTTQERMLLPPEYVNSEAAAAAGIDGKRYNAFPALFHLAAALQRSQRKFAILFRSFGNDHAKVQTEWNAFCELRHPIFSRLLEDIGPMDGSAPGVPDRRIHSIHTLYSDAAGPVLILDAFTNGPEEAPWDAWARTRPRPEADTRDGRRFIREVLRAQTVEGITGIQEWMCDHLASERTGAIKDDWAWWTYHQRAGEYGKLMTLIPGPPTQQLFLDDNIGINEPTIVDCRDVDGSRMTAARTTGGADALCLKVNPIEAILDVNYFLHKISYVQGKRSGT